MVHIALFVFFFSSRRRHTRLRTVTGVQTCALPISRGHSMRHQKKTVRLGRKAEHRKALLANQVCSLIEHRRIKTTLAKAKAVRPLAERMVTLGKNGSLHARRNALSILRHRDAVKKLFEEIAPASTERNGGYTRIIRLGQRKSDSAAMAFLEWVDAP